MHRRITGALVIATHNPGKLAEMRELLAPHGVEAVSAGELGLDEPEEAGQTFRANAAMAQIERLLPERGATTPDKRRAHFVSALCVAWPDDHLEEVEARVDGTLVWPPRGTAGFGYDPMFLPDGHSRTFGEMDSIEKHGLPPLGLGLSHRARAFVKLAEICLEPR
jgi:XTP/dITP diphosphohydrolase